MEKKPTALSMMEILGKLEEKQKMMKYLLSPKIHLQGGNYTKKDLKKALKKLKKIRKHGGSWLGKSAEGPLKVMPHNTKGVEIES